MTSFDQELYEANKVLIAVLMGHFFLRYLNRMYREFDGDLVLPIVLGEIGHHNVVNIYSRDGTCMTVLDEAGAPKEEKRRYNPTNAYSISQATGIPRETVRRKIEKLVKKGWMVKNSRGELTVTKKVAEHFTKDFNKKLLSDLLETSECLQEILDRDNKKQRSG